MAIQSHAGRRGDGRHRRPPTPRRGRLEAGLLARLGAGLPGRLGAGLSGRLGAGLPGRLAAGLLGWLALAPSASALPPLAPEPSPPPRTLARSHALWATVDVCDTQHAQYTIGVRGSMPGDGDGEDEMYMRFELERLTAVGQWEVAASSPFTLVGDASTTRQAGWSFIPTQAGHPVKGIWRGRVEFRWERAGKVLQLASRVTSGGRDASAGAEPVGYSAAECEIP